MTRPCDLMVTGDYCLFPDLSLAQDIALAIDKSWLIDRGPRREMVDKYAPKDVLDGTGKIILPGFVDAHTHAAQQLLRGCIVDELPMVWARILVPYESQLSAEEVYLGSLLYCVELLKNGFTSFLEAGAPHADQIARAAHETGLRAVICRSTMDAGEFVPAAMLDESPEQAVEETRRLRETWDGAGEGRVRVWYSIRQIMTSTPELLRKIAESAREDGSGIHIHLSEYPAEIHHCLVKYRRRPVEFLADLGVLDSNILAAHAILISELEARLLADHGVRIVHCPPTNLSNNGIGKTLLLQMLDVPIALGSDGAAHYGIDPFRLMRLLKYSVQSTQGLPVGDPAAIPAKEVIRMATSGGAEALQLGHETGGIAVGKKADLVLLPWQSPNLWPTHDLLESLTLSARGNEISDVIVDGRVLLRGGELVHLNEGEILEQARGAFESVSRRLQSGSRIR